MSEKNGKKATPGNGKANGNAQARRPRMTRDEYRKFKMERAEREDTMVIAQRTPETQDCARLLESNDFLVARLRTNFGSTRRGALTPEQALAFLQRNDELRQELNLINAEMSKAMGIDYRPPRGFSNPLATKTTEKAPEVKEPEEKPKAPAKKAEATA